jgi:hypothetical protein
MPWCCRARAVPARAASQPLLCTEGLAPFQPAQPTPSTPLPRWPVSQLATPVAIAFDASSRAPKKQKMPAPPPGGSLPLMRATWHVSSRTATRHCPSLCPSYCQESAAPTPLLCPRRFVPARKTPPCCLGCALPPGRHLLNLGPGFTPAPEYAGATQHPWLPVEMQHLACPSVLTRPCSQLPASPHPTPLPGWPHPPSPCPPVSRPSFFSGE